MSALCESAHDDEDRGLVHLHQAGDAAAFDQLYRRHFPRLVRYLRRHTYDGFLAEEVAQEAFVRAFIALEHLGGERKFYPWLTVIARRLIIDHVRSAQRQRLIADLDQDVAQAAEDQALRAMEDQDLRTALERTRARYQTVLRLRDWEGLSYREIALELGVSSATVPPLLFRARDSLRREYLALTQGRVAALWPAGSVAEMVRRVHERFGRVVAQLPEPSGFAAPAVGALVGLSLWWGPPTLGPGSPIAESGDAHAVNASHEQPAHVLSSAFAADIKARISPANNAEPHDKATNHTVERAHVEGVASWRSTRDQREMERWNRNGRQQRLYGEAGPYRIAGDPEEDLRHFEEMILGVQNRDP